MVQYGDYVVPLNTEYYTTDIVEGKFKIRTTEIQRWDNKKDIIVINKSTLDSKEPECMLMTFFEYAGNAVQEKKYKSYQDGIYQYVEIDWMRDNRIVIPDWDRQLLKRFHSDWYIKLDPILHSTYFTDLMRKSQKKERETYDVFPSKDKVFRVFEPAPDRIRVVIVGQDPYPTKGQANGLAFAVDGGVKIPPSLKMIENSLLESVDESNMYYLDSDLLEWQRQGVMLLNSSLSVAEGAPGAYAKDWKPFIEEVLEQLNKFNNNIVFWFMGKQAKEFASIITDHHVLHSEHPAYAARQERTWLHNNNFLKINELLKDSRAKPIDWLQRLPF